MATITILYVSAGILLSLLSIPLILRRIPPNYWYGFRVPTTLSDPELWYPANQYAGVRLCVVGVLTAASALLFRLIPDLTVDCYALDCLGVFLSAMTLTLWQSFRYLKKLQSTGSKSMPQGGSPPQ